MVGSVNRHGNLGRVLLCRSWRWKAKGSCLWCWSRRKSFSRVFDRVAHYSAALDCRNVLAEGIIPGRMDEGMSGIVDDGITDITHTGIIITLGLQPSGMQPSAEQLGGSSGQVRGETRTACSGRALVAMLCLRGRCSRPHGHLLCSHGRIPVASSTAPALRCVTCIVATAISVSSQAWRTCLV